MGVSRMFLDMSQPVDYIKKNNLIGYKRELAKLEFRLGADELAFLN